VHNAKKNFTIIEFKQLIFLMLIKVKKVLVKAYNSVRLVEQYYALLRRVYKIIKKELKNKHINKKMILQIVVKAVNNSARPDRIVLILLVFGLYPRITKIDPLSLIIAKRAKAICAVTKKVRRLYAKRQVNDALAIRNGLNTIATRELLLQLDVCVWREHKGWKGLYKLLAINRETYTINMLYGPTNFRSTVIRRYYAEKKQVRLVKEPVNKPVNI
jgi:hypothetical protein